MDDGGARVDDHAEELRLFRIDHHAVSGLDVLPHLGSRAGDIIRDEGRCVDLRLIRVTCVCGFEKVCEFSLFTWGRVFHAVVALRWSWR